MNQDFNTDSVLCTPIYDFRLLDELLFSIFKDDFSILHHIIWVHDSKLPLEEFRGAVHIRSTIPTIIEDDHIHAELLCVVLQPFCLICQVLVEAGIWITE